MKKIMILLSFFLLSVILFSSENLLITHSSDLGLSKDNDLLFFDQKDIVLRYSQVELNEKIFDFNKSNNAQITLNLFDDINFNAKILTTNFDINQTKSIVVKLDDYLYAYAIITQSNNRTLVNITIPEKNKLYTIISEPKQYKHYLLDMNYSDFKYLESTAVNIPEMLKLEKSVIDLERNHRPEESADIDVMIVYTPAAQLWANENGGGIENVVAQSMIKGQLVLDNSEVLINITLVYSGLVNYTEGSSSQDDLDHLTSPSSGSLDEVHTLRDAYGADLVSLFSFVNDTGGLGWLLTNQNGTPDYGFSISRVQQASWTYTHIHEMGHNMGLHHHAQQNVQPGPTSWWNWPENTWSAGWRWTGNDSGNYCSVMTYEGGQYFSDGISHSRVPYFSNPNILYQGVATGNSSSGDNARSLRGIKHIIADYKTQIVPYPTNLSGEVVSGTVVLNWETPIVTDDDLQLNGYRIYKDNEFLYFTTQNTYTDTDVTSPNQYNYYVTAVYSDQQESIPSNILSIRLTPLAKPKNLSAEVDGNNVNLEWEAPNITDFWFTHSQNESEGLAIGYNTPAQFTVAHRYSVEQIYNLGIAGSELSKVSFKSNHDTAQYTVKVWTGGSANPYNSGQEVISQLVGTNPIGNWMEVILDTPVIIPADQELWIGYYIDTPGGFPASTDPGPVVEGYGNLIHNGSWTTLSNMGSNLTFNWQIKAYSQTSNRMIEFSNQTNRNLEGYNVYQNQNLLTAQAVTTTNYTDNNVPAGTYTYSVSSLYNSGESEQISVEVEVVAAQTYTLDLLVHPQEAGIVSGPETFNYQTIINEDDLEYIANTGWNFIGWTSDAEGNNPIVFPVTMPAEDVSWYAQFELIPYDVTLTAVPENGGVLTGADEYTLGDIVTVSAEANEGYDFAHWSLTNGRNNVSRNREILSTEPVYEFTMPAHDVNLFAHFTMISYNLTLVVNPENAGTVSGPETFNFNTIINEIDLTVENNAGWSFIGWTSDAEGNNPVVFPVTMPAEDITWYAQFEQIEYTVSLSVNPENTGTVTGVGSYHYNDSVTVTATANEGYQFVNWTLETDGRNLLSSSNQILTSKNMQRQRDVVSTDSVYTFTMPENNVNLTAHFELIPVFNPPQNLSVEVSYTEILLTWEAPDNRNRALVGYKVYRDSLAITEVVTESMFTDTEVLPNIEYTYFVTAIYQEPNGESIPSNEVSASLLIPVFNPPVNLAGEAEEDSIILIWESPQGIPETMTLAGYKVYRDSLAITGVIETTQYTDTNISLNNTYRYFVTAVYVNPDGESIPSNEEIINYVSENDLTITPTITKLNNNYPNPFNPETTISFSLKEASNVQIEIFDIKGRKVKTLINKEYNHGNHTITWNAKDDKGKELSSGMYFYRMKTNTKIETKKMLLIK